MRIFAYLLMSLALVPLQSQSTVRLERMPVELPATDASVEAVAVVETESGSMLVTEMLINDVRAFYMFVWTGNALEPQAIGPRTIPASFEAPPTHQPISRSIGGRTRRYWQVRGVEHQRSRTERYWVSAPRLSELTYAALAEGEFPLTPPVDSPLTLEVVVEKPTGDFERACLLDPNILAVEDRLTTLDASWIRPVDERYLVVTVGTSGTSGVGRVAFWLFDEAYRLRAVTEFDATYDVNRLPEPMQVDLTGDGVNELLIVNTAQTGGEPFVVYRLEKSSAPHRVLHFRQCGPRMQGEDVARLQQALEDAGYSVGPHAVDGWYGPDTRAAVIRYQRDRGLEATGVFDTADPLP